MESPPQQPTTKEEFATEFKQFRKGKVNKENEAAYVQYCKQPIIRIGAWNIHGVNVTAKEKQQEKIDHIMEKDLDFVALIETWHGKLNLPGYEQIEHETTKPHSMIFNKTLW